MSVTYDVAAAREMLAGAPGEVLLAAVMGSHAFNLATEHSDMDLRGVFRLPTRQIVAVTPHDQVHTTADPDVVLHEVGRFMSLALAANPTMLELLFNEDRLVLHPDAEALVAARHAFLSVRARASFAGYANNQLRDMAKRDASQLATPRGQKWARHVLRMVRLGHQVVTTGTMNVRVADPDELFEFARQPRDRVLDQIRSELAALEVAPTVLAARPDFELANQILWDLRGV